jgi:hypothetical protein
LKYPYSNVLTLGSHSLKVIPEGSEAGGSRVIVELAHCLAASSKFEQ